MSGGSYDYLYGKIDDMADSLRRQDLEPRRAAFAKLLKLVADACHDIEWVDSCDYGKGDDHEAIDKVFAFLKADPEVIKKAHAYDALVARLQEFFTEKRTKSATEDSEVKKGITE